MMGITSGGKLTNYLWVATVISVIVLFLGLSYYFQSVQKERYFDQLYFRQLEEISHGFETNLVRLRSFTRVTQQFIYDAFDNELENLSNNIVRATSLTASPDVSLPTDDFHKDQNSPLDSTLPYQPFFDSQFGLTSYVSDLTKTQLVQESSTEVAELYNELESGVKIILNEDLESILTCSIRVDSPIFNRGLLSDYCDSLEAIVSVLRKLPEYAKIDLKSLDNDILSSVKESISTLVSIKTTAKSLTSVDPKDEIRISKDIIELLRKLANDADKAADPIIAYNTYRSTYQSLKGDIADTALKQLLDTHYKSEVCANPCRDRPNADLAVLLEKETHHQIAKKSLLSSDYILTRFILIIAEHVPSLVSDLENFASSAEKARTIPLRSKSVKSSNSDQQYKDRARLTEHKYRYLADSGPLAASAARHGLGLEYVKKACDEDLEKKLNKENCEGALLVGTSEKTNPYAVSNLVVISYLPAGYAFIAPMDNLLPRHMGDFSATLITTEDGDVIIQNDSLTNIGNQQFLGINDLLAGAISESGTYNKPDNCAQDDPDCTKQKHYQRLEHSSYVDEIIGGTAYRLYIRPYKVGQIQMYFEDKPGPQDTLYFVGIKPLQELRTSKFRISPGASIVLFSIVTALLLVFVFLKIRLAHVDASFIRADGLITVFAVVLFISLSTIGIATLGLWDKLNRETEADAYRSIDILQDRFINEIRSYIRYIDYLLLNKDVVTRLVPTINDKNNDDFRKTMTSEVRKAVFKTVSSDTKTPSIFDQFLDLDVNDEMLDYEPITKFNIGFSSYEYGAVPYISDNKNRPLEIGGISQNAVSPIENIFMLDNKGRLTGELIRGTKYLVSFPPNVLGSRRYFLNANEGEVWEIQLECSDDMMLSWCPTAPVGTAIVPVYIERIFNIIDGGRNTQFAIPVRHQNNRYTSVAQNASIFDARKIYDIDSDEPTVISFGLSLHTFKAPILPSGLQFAVIDNHSGKVIYHSDDDRSLIENFIHETEYNPQLNSIIRVAQGTDNNDYDVDGYMDSFSGVYRGTDTVFYAGKLHKDIPWTLIVFKEIEDTQLLVTLLFSISIVIALAIMLFTAAILFFISLKYPRIFQWLWPQISKSNTYNKISGLCLILTIPIYLLFLVSNNLLVLFLLVSMVAVAIVLLVSLVVNRSAPLQDGVTPDLGQHRRRYIGLMLSVLLVTTAVPSLVIVEKVSGELLHRTGKYNIVELNEQKREAQNVIDARLDRLCGKTASVRRKYDSCNSIQRILLGDLYNYVHTLGEAHCTHNNNRLFCLSNHPDTTEQHHNSMDISLLLRWLEPIWELPALLVTLEHAHNLTLMLNEGPPYRVIHAHPRYASLLVAPYWTFLLVLITWFIAAVAIRFLAVNLLGINVPRSYRAAQCTLDSSNWDDFVLGKLPQQATSQASYEKLTVALNNDAPYYAIMIRPLDKNLIAFFDWLDHNNQTTGPAYLKIDILQYSCESRYREQIFNSLCSAEYRDTLLVLENIESVAFDKQKRTTLLNFIESQMADEPMRSILILCDVAPLYMLTQQSEYVPEDMKEEFADAQEVVRWSRLLFKFNKYYDWNPMEIDFDDTDPWENLVIRELSAWPEMYPHKAGLNLLKNEGKSEECAIQYISTHAGSIYRRRWSFCTKKEKLILYQLAKGLMINPQNVEPLEHLMRRGFIRRDPNWSIVSKSFARFVITAENESVYNEWVTASEQSLWKILRIPLFTAVIVIVGILMYSAQEATESFLAIATSVLALLPLLLRNLNVTTTTQTTAAEN